MSVLGVPFILERSGSKSKGTNDKDQHACARIPRYFAVGSLNHAKLVLLCGDGVSVGDVHPFLGRRRGKMQPAASNQKKQASDK